MTLMKAIPKKFINFELTFLINFSFIILQLLKNVWDLCVDVKLFVFNLTVKNCFRTCVDNVSFSCTKRFLYYRFMSIFPIYLFSIKVVEKTFFNINYLLTCSVRNNSIETTKYLIIPLCRRMFLIQQDYR